MCAARLAIDRFLLSPGASAVHEEALAHGVAARVRRQVQDSEGDVFDAVARTAKGPERARLWAEAAKVWPQYDDYQRATKREIPVEGYGPRLPGDAGAARKTSVRQNSH